jgi:hypothetical protein
VSNALYFGDNLDVLRASIASGSTELVCLDYSFNANTACGAWLKRFPSNVFPTQGETCGNKWHWRKHAETVCQELIGQIGSQYGRWIVLLALLLASGSAMSMQFTLSDTTPRGYKLSQPAFIASGAIVEGDAARLLAFLRLNRKEFVDNQLHIVVDSPGGSIAEAIQVATLLEQGMATLWLPVSTTHNKKAPRCASACFAFVAASASRTIADDTVFIHRPYFEAKAFVGLTYSEAQQAHEKLIADFAAWLDRKRIPRTLIEKMISKSSREAYPLDLDDIDAIGSVAPWAEEYLIAKCSFDKSLWRRFQDASVANNEPAAARLGKQFEQQSNCVKTVRRDVRARLLDSKW